MTNKKTRIQLLENGELENGVAKLRIASYPDFPEVYDIDFYERLYRWYGTHPLASEIKRWVAITGESQVVGHVAAVPQYYWIGGERVVAHTPADYMVLPGYGFQALSLMRRFFRETENCVACDMVPAVIRVEARMGAEVTGEMQYAAKLLNVSRLPVPPVPERIRKALKLPSYYAPARGYEPSGPSRTPSEGAETLPGTPQARPRAPIPAPLKRFLNRTLGTVDGALGVGYGTDLKAQKLDRFDESFDSLFSKVAAAIPCTPEKDAAFLNWRYGPGSPQHPVTILGIRGSEGLLGYAVLKITSAGQDGYILDLTTLPGHRKVAQALLRDSVAYFRQAGTHIIRYRFLESPTSPQTRDLWRMGFFSRRGRRNYLLVNFADRNLHEIGRKLENWSYNVGDGEATFWIR